MGSGHLTDLGQDGLTMEGKNGTFVSLWYTDWKQSADLSLLRQNLLGVKIIHFLDERTLKMSEPQRGKI